MRSATGVLVLGSTNLDLVATAARIPGPGETVLGSGYAEHPGGKGLNQALAAVRSGAPTRFVSAIGSDAAGEQLLALMTANGLGIESVRVRPEVPTGRALIMVSDTGENSILVAPGANSLVTTPTIPASIGVLLAQLEVPIDVVAESFVTARSMGITTILNPAPAAPLVPELAATCDIVVPNEHELDALGGVERLLGAGIGTVIVTLGARGVEIFRHDANSSSRLPSFPVDVVDTTGAGDSFCGALAAQLAAGASLHDAVRWATAAGALATTVRGAVPSIPTAEQIIGLLADHAR